MTELMIGLIISMVFSAFFSGMEIAFVSSNRLRAEMDREKNGLSQRALAVFYAHPSNFISTMRPRDLRYAVVDGRRALYRRVFAEDYFQVQS